MTEPLYRRLGIAATILVFGLGMTACRQEGPVEKAGKKVDEALENAGDKLEEVGDKIEDAADGTQPVATPDTQPEIKPETPPADSTDPAAEPKPKS